MNEYCRPCFPQHCFFWQSAPLPRKVEPCFASLGIGVGAAFSHLNAFGRMLVTEIDQPHLFVLQSSRLGICYGPGWEKPHSPGGGGQDSFSGAISFVARPHRQSAPDPASIPSPATPPIRDETACTIGLFLAQRSGYAPLF